MKYETFLCFFIINLIQPTGKDEVFVVSNKERNGWYRVIKYGDKCSGWIHKSRVSILSKALDFFDEKKEDDFKDFEEYYWWWW